MQGWFARPATAPDVPYSPSQRKQASIDGTSGRLSNPKTAEVLRRRACLGLGRVTPDPGDLPIADLPQVPHRHLAGDAGELAHAARLHAQQHAVTKLLGLLGAGR